MSGNIVNGICIDYHDGEGECTIGNQYYRWEFSERFGPLFFVNKRKKEWVPNSPSHPVWTEFYKWLKRYKMKRKTAKSWEIVQA